MARLEHCLSHHGSNPNPINPKLTDIPESGPIFGLFLLTMKGTVKNNFKWDYIIPQKMSCTKLSTLVTSGEAEHLGCFSGCCMKAKDIPPTTMPPPLFLSMPTIPPFKYLLLKYFAIHHMLFVAKHIFGCSVWYRTYFQLFRHFLRFFLAKILLFWPA